MKSSKKYISEYICLKILKGSYQAGDVIYSEHKLAIKFNCSRLTARSALIVLVNAGILYSRKGKGYIVSPNATSILFYAKKLFDLGNNHVFAKVSDYNIKTLFDITGPDLELYSIKTLYNDELLSLSYIVISKKSMAVFYESGYDFSQDTIMKIINTGFVPNTIENAFEIKGVLPIMKEDVQKLGYTSDFVPFVKQVMFDNSNQVPFVVYSVPNKSKEIFSVKTSILIN